MSTDYYLRLTAVISDHGEGRRLLSLVNQHTEVGLLLCIPVLVLMLGLARWVIGLLYSNAFGPGAGVLRWHLLSLGDILKV